MPTAPPARCTQCPNPATKNGRCPDHQPKPWTNPSQRNTKINRWKWQQTRNKWLTQHPTCTHCHAPGTEVDHITPVAQGGALYHPANLQTLCTECHTQKTKNEKQKKRQ